MQIKRKSLKSEKKLFNDNMELIIQIKKTFL